MRPDAATLTAPEVVDHGVLAAVLKQGAFDPADGALALRHREEEQHGTYRIERICVRCVCLSDFEHSTTTNALILLWLGGQGRNRTSDTVIFSLTRRDCRELVQAIADRGAGIYANRIAALLSRLFRFAVDEEIIEANPAAHLPKPGVEIGSRPEGELEAKAYSADEVRTIWEATEALGPSVRAIYRLGLMTGQRPTEISGMEWAKLDGHWWTIPGRRTKNGREHRVYLTQTALDALQDVPRTSDSHVFVGWRGKRQLAAVNAEVFAGVRRREKPRHALRDTVATGLAAAGVAVEDITKVLNHTYGPRVTQGYDAYGYDKEKRLALMKWERSLRAIVDGKASGVTKVVRLASGA